MFVCNESGQQLLGLLQAKNHAKVDNEQTLIYFELTANVFTARPCIKKMVQLKYEFRAT